MSVQVKNQVYTFSSSSTPPQVAYQTDGDFNQIFDDTSFLPDGVNHPDFNFEDEDVQRMMNSTDRTQDPFINSLSSDESWASIATFGPRCNRCGNPCGTDVIYCENLAFHKRHFTCKLCKTVLDSPIPINGEIYCQNCSESIKPSSHCCYICGAQRTPASIFVAGHAFCPNHFKCYTCQTPLNINNFTQRQGHFYCPKHVPVRPVLQCAKCGTEIPSKAIHALGAFYHPECFICCSCGSNLASKQYVTTEGHPICTSCFKKLPKTSRLAAAQYRPSHP